MIPESVIYEGTLRHRRFLPTRHEFEYSIFMAFLDIDKIPEVMRRSAVSGYNRWNWASFHECDHFGDATKPLRERLRIDAAAHGLTLPGGPIFLLTHLRYLGYCFNPISLYFCYSDDGAPGTVLAEVNSTFGESKNYWLAAHNRLPGENSLRFTAPKAMHVSPFMGMNLDYEFVFTEPAERLVAHMNTLDGGHSFFDATLTLERTPWTSASLTRALVRQPWMTAKVIASIHWEALRLWWKRVPVHTHPAKRPGS
jgi:DUF1365 family protein